MLGNIAFEFKSATLMSGPLEGNVALVTGGGRGLGRACAEGLAESGAKVIAIARTATDLEAVSAHPSGRIDAWQGDIADAAMLARIESLPDLSILVNNAGANRPQPFSEVDPESLDFVIDLNVRATFRAAQAAVRNMLANETRGVIINMSSQMGHVGSPNRTVYCMTKHAVEGLTKAMAVELAPNGIRVNSVAPTFVETPLTKPMLDDPAFRKFVMDRIPLQQLATMDDVVQAVLYLTSPGARMVTGHSLVVDGGWTAH